MRREARRSRDRCYRLHEDLRRPDSIVYPPKPCLPSARHRWVRPLGFPRQASSLLRSESLLRDNRGAQGARRSGRIQIQGRFRSNQEIRDRSGKAQSSDCLIKRVPGASAAQPGTPIANRASMGTPREVLVPDIGDFKNVDVIEVLVKPGDAVQPEQSLITVESDKATMEIPSPAAGVVKELRVKTGDKVSQGSPILVLEETEIASVAPAKPAPKSPDAPKAKPAPVLAAVPASAPAATAVGRIDPVSSTSAPVSEATPHASPSVRKFARELGVDLIRVKGSGPKGRITQTDVQEFVKGFMRGAPAGPAARGGLSLDLPDWPQVDFAKFGSIEIRALSRIRKLAGGNLRRNWVGIPH